MSRGLCGPCDIPVPFLHLAFWKLNNAAVKPGIHFFVLLIEILLSFIWLFNFLQTSQLSLWTSKDFFVSVSDRDLTNQPEILKGKHFGSIAQLMTVHRMPILDSCSRPKHTNQAHLQKRLSQQCLLLPVSSRTSLVWIVTPIHNYAVWELEWQLCLAAVWCLGGLYYVVIILCVLNIDLWLLLILLTNLLHGEPKLSTILACVSCSPSQRPRLWTRIWVEWGNIRFNP